MYYHIEVEYPEINGEYQFIFTGVESKDGELICRVDRKIDKSSSLLFTFESEKEPYKIIIWPYSVNGEWSDKREILYDEKLNSKQENQSKKEPEEPVGRGNEAFYLCGDLGDIIYALSAIKKRGGGHLFIGGDFPQFPCRSPLTRQKSIELARIISEQDYIKSVTYSLTKPPGSIDLNYFKKGFIKLRKGELSKDEIETLRTTRLTKLFSDLLEVEDNFKDQWIEIPNTIEEYKDKIIVNRTSRYHNSKFPWKDLLEAYGDEMIFIGLPEEHEQFEANIGKIKYLKCKDLFHLATIINSCKIFIGNQSFCYSLAEGLKKTNLLETDEWIYNCNHERDNSLIFNEDISKSNVLDYILFHLSNIFYNKSSVESSKEQKRILYIGQSGTSGYAKACKGYVYNFITEGHNIEWVPLVFDRSTETNSYVDLACKQVVVNEPTGEYDEIHIHCTCDIWDEILTKYSDLVKKAKKIIGFSVWETDRIPNHWVNCINASSIDELHVPSVHNKRSYWDSGVKKPIFVKPHYFYPEKLPERKNVNITSVDGKVLDTKKFTFYNVSEFTLRKGIRDSLKIFSEVYGDRKDVQYLLKLHYKNYTCDNEDYIKKELKDYINKSNIFIVIKNLTQRELQAFHSVGDCYFTLHKGEGFGLVIHEAFNYGKKVISTGYGGQIDFLKNDYPYIVKHKLRPVEGMKSFSHCYDEKQNWGIPDLEHAKIILKKVYK